MYLFKIQKSFWKKQLNKENTNFFVIIYNEKISLAKELKNEGYSIDKILKITKLSKNIVMAL